MNSPKNICLNCGKYGHLVKKCVEPITSNGIICFNLNKDLKISNKILERFFYNKYIDMIEFNYLHLNNINLIPEYYDKLKLLMIRRKDSLNYIGFIRGKYDTNNIKKISKLFSLMTRDENISIKTNDFDTLWNLLWKEGATNNKYKNEYITSKHKFNELKKHNFYDLLNDANLSKYIEPEWGFPKGRRDLNESNIECAMREFNEETNLHLPADDILILDRLNPIEETYKGTNDIIYRHIYYMASINKEVDVLVTNTAQHYEISDIKWMTVNEALNKLRIYDESKIHLINQVYFFIINIIKNII